MDPLIFDRVYKRDQNIVRAKVGDAISQAGVNAGVRNTQGTGKKLPGGKLYCSGINLATTMATL